MKLDKSWFTSMVHTHQNDFYRIAFHILKNKDDAEDALQEALFRAYSNLHQLEQPQYFKTWMTRIIMNTSFEIQRKHKPTLDLADYAETLGDYQDMTTNIMLEQAIQKLDEKYQQVILLFYYENYSVKEISGVLNVSTINVKQRLSRSRKLLKEFLSEQEKGAV